MVWLRERWVLWVVGALAALGFMAIGYVARGSGTPPRRTDVQQVRAVVNAFANASDARACDFLTNEALDGIYGGKRRCIKRSRKFQAGSVRISRVVVSVPTASVRATGLDGKVLFTVKLQRQSRGCRGGIPGNPWLISSVRSAPNV